MYEEIDKTELYVRLRQRKNKYTYRVFSGVEQKEIYYNLSRPNETKRCILKEHANIWGKNIAQNNYFLRLFMSS